MTGGQYNAALSLFFVSYALFEPLTNVLIKTWTPRVFLTATISLWGVVMVTMGGTIFILHPRVMLTLARVV